jgi:hypothetical protein
MEDGSLELFSNLANEMIDELVMSHKNCLFSTRIESKKITEKILSTKKFSELNNLNTRKKFEFLFDIIPILMVFAKKVLKAYL